MSAPLTEVMAQLMHPAPWGRSTVRAADLEALVDEVLLPPNTDQVPPVWIVPTSEEREPKPPSSNIVSLVRLHERGFGVPAGKFIRALCHRYKVELHNFTPNSISQAAVFIAVCEGYLGVEVH